VETCRIPSTPIVYRLPSSTSVWIQWDVPREGTTFCNVLGYQVIAESYDDPDYNFTFDPESDNITGAPSEMLGSLSLEHVVPGLAPLAPYRFKVRSHIASGQRDSSWTYSHAGGVPSQMTAPTHNLNYSSVSSVYVSWDQPDMNGGSPVGYQLFRDDGPGSYFRDGPETSCIGATAPTGDFSNVATVPYAAGCSVSGLKKDTFYRFKVRAINSLGPGPLSSAALVPVGTAPSVKPPYLESAAFENCTMTWRWLPAVENGRLAYDYELKLQAIYATAAPSSGDDNGTTTMAPVVPEMVWSLDGTLGRPFLAMEMTLNSSSWSGLTPGGRYRAAVRAASGIGISAWSEWSSLDATPSGYCLSVPLAPTGLRRDPAVLVRAGRLQLAWDAVNSPDQAGGDDPIEGGVYYEIWGKPNPDWANSSWRSLLTFATHQLDPLGIGPMVPLPAAAMVDTYPETPVTSSWVLKLRVRNKNLAYGPFGSQIRLSTGQLASAPRSLTAGFAPNGKVELRWKLPQANGYTPLLKYEARCNQGSWSEVDVTSLSHVLQDMPAAGPATCEVRAVNSVGPGPAVSTSIAIL